MNECMRAALLWVSVGFFLGLFVGCLAMANVNGYEWLDKNNCRELSKGVVLCTAFENP